MDLVQHTKNAIMLVLHNQSKLTKDEFNMEGMSGMRGRMFLNNMCSVSDVKYLEIGLWKGSTFCSALKDNAVRALGIDNWSQFHGPKDECLKNIERYSGSNKVEIIDADCFSIDTSQDTRLFVFILSVQLFFINLSQYPHIRQHSQVTLSPPSTSGTPPPCST